MAHNDGPSAAALREVAERVVAPAAPRSQIAAPVPETRPLLSAAVAEFRLRRPMDRIVLRTLSTQGHS
jgi:hypothetical protein